MSLKMRLMFLSALWLIFILVLFNVFIYFFVIHITTQSEIQLLFKKAVAVLEKEQVDDPSQWKDPQLLNEFLVNNEIIRIITPDSQVQNQLYSNEKLLAFKSVYREGAHSKVINNGESRFLFVQVPIYQGEHRIAMLEIGRLMNILDEYMSVLVTALTVTTAGAVLLSIAGGYFYTKFLFRPIKYLADTMQTIQESGDFQTLSLDYATQKDEFWQLCLTFNRMMDRLELNFIQQKQFMEDASHELRTPLTIIESYASLLKRWASNDEKLREEAVEAIYSESVRLKTMVSDLMQLVDSHTEERPHFAPLNVVPLIRAAASSLQYSFRRDIAVEVEEDDMEIMGDKKKIKQLLIILLDNAIKYSSKKIRITARRKKDRVVISVIDQGIGIPKGKIPFIFDRFYRVDKARSRSTGGAGLGLAIARAIVQSHEGSIRVDSAYGQGTTVSVEFPHSGHTPRR